MSDNKTLDELSTRLENLIGLNEVKKSVKDVINLIKINNMRKEQGMVTTSISKHMVFTGNPGTGKTTVARLLSQIYKELGVLSKGTFVETDRSGLVAGYVGQTALKVTEVVNKAKGGILFIDEAYSLSRSKDNSDFGKEAIDTLVKLMEDNREDLIVIVAGYSDEMKAFIDANTGLASRFNKYIDFPDYSLDDLMNIFRYMYRNMGLLVSESASEATKNYFRSKIDDNKKFGNARGVRNYLESIVVNQANRLVKIENPDKFMLMTIEKDDCMTTINKNYI